MTITDTTTVAEIATALPASVRVFQRHEIDFCCGGKRPLADVCTDRGLQFGAIVTEIEAAAPVRPDPDTNWVDAPLPSLTAHIVRTYHDSLRDELPRLEAMAAKVAMVHGAKDERLARVAKVVTTLSDDMQSHMMKEERVLFPAIDALETPGAAAMRLEAPISMMEHEHDQAGAFIAELRSLTDGYQPPQWACGTVRALFAGLGELEGEMHVHVHLENNILFPRALRSLGSA